MSRDPASWNERYRQGEQWGGAEPASFLVEVLPLLPRGAALDIAMGAGRNAIFLAEHGWRVTGIDFSRAALEKAEAVARERGIYIWWSQAGSPGLASTVPGIVLVEADLESCMLPAGPFDLVVCFRYLQRSLFTVMVSVLRPGGMLVYEAHTLDQLNFSRGQKNPEHLLGPQELRDAFSALDILFYREFAAGQGLASLLARRWRRLLLPRRTRLGRAACAPV